MQFNPLGDITLSQIEGLIMVLGKLKLDDLQIERVLRVIDELDRIVDDGYIGEAPKSEVDEAIDKLFKTDTE